MQSLARVADQRGQALFDVEVDVLEIARPGELAAFDLAADRRHSALDVGDVGGGQDADGAEHPRVRERRGDVGVGQLAIEVDRCGVQLDEFGDRLAEAAGPAARRVSTESGIAC